MQKRYEASYSGYVYEKPKTHWSSEADVKSSLRKVDFTQKGEIEAGGVPVISDGKTAYVDTSDTHTAVYAISGMKKSICVFMTTIYCLARAGENMLLTDPKGELYDRTSGYLKSQGYKVNCLDFRSLDKDAINILEYPARVYRQFDTDKGLMMLSDIVNTLAEEQRRRAKDPFWPDTGAQWCNATGSLMFDSYPKIEQINILNWSDYNNWESAKRIEKLLPFIPDGNTVKKALKETVLSADNTLRSILITASSFLSMFNQNNKLARMLSHSTFHLEDLCKKKTALYIVTDDTTTTADSIVGIIISQIQTFLVENAYNNGGKLDTRFNFIMDEFASFAIPDMDKALATHRSRGIRYYLCVQTLDGLKQRYEHVEAMLANCGNTLFLGSTERELLERISTQCGTTCITPTGAEKLLCSPAELMTLKKAWDYKEALYLNLPDAIRYCTTLPSIEAYDMGNYPAPIKKYRHPRIASYTVERFINDIAKERIEVPFSVDKKRMRKRKAKENAAKSEKDILDEKLQEELEQEFEKLFGELDTEE
ncbi:type IV secretory system conjugative DNA transfer family protein [Blautia stercoris]